MVGKFIKGEFFILHKSASAFRKRLFIWKLFMFENKTMQQKTNLYNRALDSFRFRV